MSVASMTPKSNLSDQVSVYSVIYSMYVAQFRARHKMTVLSFCVSDDGHHVCVKSSVPVSQSRLLNFSDDGTSYNPLWLSLTVQ